MYYRMQYRQMKHSITVIESIQLAVYTCPNPAALSMPNAIVYANSSLDSRGFIKGKCVKCIGTGIRTWVGACILESSSCRFSKSCWTGIGCTSSEEKNSFQI